jgi:hypothetical protein
MRSKFPIQFILVLALVAGLGLNTARLTAQPFGPKAPDPNPLTVRGTVQSFTQAPRGEVDGLILADGTWVHWPPLLGDRFTAIVSKGDQVKAVGFMETGPKGDTKLEVFKLTNLRTGKNADNPDRPLAGPVVDNPSPAVGPSPQPNDFESRLQALERQLNELRKEIERLRREK